MGTRPKLIRYKEPLKSILEKTAQGLSEAGRLRQVQPHPSKVQVSITNSLFSDWRDG
jgi:hypothetical protein